MRSNRKWQVLVLALLAIAWFALAQTNSSIKGFKVPVYYPPPHDSQMSTLLEGAEAEPGTEGRILITRGKIQYFNRDGKLEMLVEAPHCTWDTARQAVSSPGPLRVHSADGKLTLEGEGFLWLQTNSNLTISNRVRTVIFGAPEKAFQP